MSRLEETLNRIEIDSLRVLAAICAILALTVALPLSGCDSDNGADGQGPESSSTDVYVEYTNDEFGFTAQFPAKQGEDTASWGHRYGSSFTVDSFDAPPNYDPTVQGIAIPRTVLRAYRPDDWPRETALSEVYEQWQLEEMLSSDLESELSPLLMRNAADLHPPIEFALRDGHPSATSIFPLTNSEHTIWCYVTVVYQDDGDSFSLAGIRETEGDAIAAEASFRLIEPADAIGSAKASSSTNSEPTYSNPLWPTTYPELLAIPEADRWYNSREQVGSYGTIAGPVASVAHLDNRVMVNIGADYPDPSRAQVVIWAEDVSSLQDVLDAIDHGNAWVAVSGEISEYGGVAEIDVSDGRTEWRWWTVEP